MKHCKFVEFSSNLNVKPTLHKRKASPHKRKAPIDDFLATVLSWPQCFFLFVNRGTTGRIFKTCFGL